MSTPERMFDSSADGGRKDSENGFALLTSEQEEGFDRATPNPLAEVKSIYEGTFSTEEEKVIRQEIQAAIQRLARALKTRVHETPDGPRIEYSGGTLADAAEKGLITEQMRDESSVDPKGLIAAQLIFAHDTAIAPVLNGPNRHAALAIIQNELDLFYQNSDQES